ncbi:MAG: hypothetical protein IME98_00435, partial [Proteobacteria bacterium]|nr:hypothetical protein [Pseudomonadota bacterium]
MLTRKITYILVFAFSITILICSSGVASEKSITESYIEAFETNNQTMTYKIVEDNVEKIPAELKTLIYSTMAPNVEVEKKEATLYIAEQMAITYKEVTGDFEPLREIKKEQFESKLSVQ